MKVDPYPTQETEDYGMSTAKERLQLLAERLLMLEHRL